MRACCCHHPHHHHALSYRNEWWVPGKILEIRHRLADNWRTSGNRDVLLLDIALDNYFRWGQGVEGGGRTSELLNAMLNGEETGKGLQGFMASISCLHHCLPH